MITIDDRSKHVKGGKRTYSLGITLKIYIILVR